MGSIVSKILQRRGDKERKALWLKRGVLYLLLALVFLGFFSEFPITHHIVWFAAAITTFLACAVLHILHKRTSYSFELFAALALLIAGAVQSFAIPWLYMTYFPLFLLVSVFHSKKTALAFFLFILLLTSGDFLRNERIHENIGLVLLLTITAGIAHFFFRETIQTEGNHAAPMVMQQDHFGGSPPDVPSISDEKALSYYLESMFKPGEECEELLAVVKNTLFADSVNLFINADNTLKLHCSTDDAQKVIPSHSGVIYNCFRQKNTFIADDIQEKKIDPGYLKKEKISSLVAVPVLDDAFTVGVLTADSSRYQAFSSADRDILQKFAQLMSRIMQRERFSPHIRRSLTHLKMLHEESARLLSSLNMDVIIQNLLEGSRKIVPSNIVFFSADGKNIDTVHEIGLQQEVAKMQSVRGTLLDMVMKNKEPLYLSDVRGYRSPMPFKTKNVGSILIVPLLYERELLGLLVLLMEKTEALSPQERELLEVLCNQASTSIVNARFHAEIERLAISDGLTGLFNHRHFQERLSQEFKRLERFNEPLSLLMMDIDYFKKINDMYGHPVGDAVLQGVASLISKTIRNIDVAARYGGEEFAIILVKTEPKGALKIAERLRKVIMQETFSEGKKTFNVTVSIGISSYPDHGNEQKTLIDRADKALYQAKHSGRNQSVLWDDRLIHT